MHPQVEQSRPSDVHSNGLACCLDGGEEDGEVSGSLFAELGLLLEGVAVWLDMEWIVFDVDSTLADAPLQSSRIAAIQPSTHLVSVTILPEAGVVSIVGGRGGGGSSE